MGCFRRPVLAGVLLLCSAVVLMTPRMDVARKTAQQSLALPGTTVQTPAGAAHVSTHVRSSSTQFSPLSLSQFEDWVAETKALAARERPTTASHAGLQLPGLHRQQPRPQPHWDPSLLPWLQRGVPTPRPWEGLHHDLAALLKLQARNNSVALVVFSDGFAALALNCITSLVVYGKAEAYVVAAMGATSLEQCKKLRLPCFDATGLVDGAMSSEPLRNSKEWFQHVWAKTLVVHEVFQHGVDVLFADADTVFIKDVKHYTHLLDTFGADGSFMYEEANRTDPVTRHTKLIRYLNSGNFYLRNNERTRVLMEKWKQGYYLTGTSAGNQLWLNHMASWPEDAPFAICHTRKQCATIRARGLAAIKPHPHQFPGTAQPCLPDHLYKWEELCAERRVYVHAVCRSGSAAKQRAFEELGLWFLHVYSMPEAVDVRLPVNGSVLPCRGAGALSWGLKLLQAA